MADPAVSIWARPSFVATPQDTKIFFVCFGKGPLAELPLSLARFGLPSAELLEQVGIRQHDRTSASQWFEDWWAGAFGVYAKQDLGADLALLTTSDTCVTLEVDLSDRADLLPLQSVWSLARWLCARGMNVVLDVHAFRFRTRETIEQLGFEGYDVSRELKLVLESDATAGELHLLHTRGLCKVARPELLCFVRPEDARLMGTALNQLAHLLSEGVPAEQLQLRLAEGVELVTQPARDPALVDALGLEAAVELVRRDGAPLGGIAAELLG